NASDKVRYAFLTDIHVSPGKESEKALTQIVNEVNKGSFDFVIFTGDLTNVGADVELKTVKDVLSDLHIPYYIISGNHENTWSESVGKTFRSLFGEDRFVFDCGKYRFFGIPTGPYMKMGNGHTKEEDIEWLNDQLNDPSSKGKTLIAAAHYPLTDGIDNWYKITDILKEAQVSYVMCGHGHTLSLLNFDGIPGIMGRATFTRNGSGTGGYNIVDLANDSVYVYEKIVGKDDLHPFTKFGLDGDQTILDGFPVSKRPDYSVNGQYKNVEEAFVIENSASVFTGIAYFKNDVIVYGCSDGKIKAWDISDDKHPRQLWEKQVNGSVYTTPLTAGDAVVVGSIDGELTAYYSKTGNIKWNLSLGKTISGNGRVKGNYLYIGADADLYKINVENGKIIWKYSATGRLQAEPLILSNQVIFGAWDTYLYCLNKKNGTLNWKWSNGNSQILYSPGDVVPVANKDVVYIVAPDRYMTAINLKDGKTLWRSNDFKVRESIGISQDGKTIYAKTMNDSIIAVHTSKDKMSLAYALNAGYGYEHNPSPMIEVNYIIYLGTCDGTLIAIDSKNHQIKWKHKCGNSGINDIKCDKKGNILVSLIEGKIMKIFPHQ
ncbi:MAG: PQQ-binding-like beta-propeller repeat protein, partial [Bacteroidales bacterium]|nr:PQQ-binding-like beta-propeller repeat protein [Bacteroidales bacterium]